MPAELTIDTVKSLHPCTRDWFRQAFRSPTRVQSNAWPVLAGGNNALLLAPTGSGKTLAAFLTSIDRMFFERDHNTPADTAERSGVRVIYISPLKALGVDVDRNLRAPIAGLRAFAEREQVPHRVPAVAVRSGDTTQRERARILRDPPDILITTPESLYLMLTSRAREILSSVETVIVDEIHAMAGTKRGSHLFVSLERLERLVTDRSDPPTAVATPKFQRIGLSATQRPLSEIAELLGGAVATASPETAPQRRPVTIIDASEPRRFRLTIETPAEERQPPGEPDDDGAPMSHPVLPVPSVWPAIHPRLVELIRSHQSTMIFVNSRRMAERLSSAINELAEEEIALAHHGSVAKDVRADIEDRLKRGTLPAIVATSSMELGIDMGAVDLVIQIEAPPSIASGTQRIGRAGHQVGAESIGIVFPKFRGDLLACAAASGAMHKGWVEETRYPRNPLDVLAQQIVAIVADHSIQQEELYALVRGAAPFFELPHSSFVGVLDLLSGRYPSDEFSELKPRLNWDRVSGMVSARRGSQRLAILNGGTIPDRGLYGVFLAGADGETGSRVGELDEEMVFECRPGDVFLLGASGWRVLEITRDRVIVVPAPGEPGRMPFWRGDGPGRPLEFGKAIGQLTRQLVETPHDAAMLLLQNGHGLEASAAETLLTYLKDQQSTADAVPHDERIVVECFPDEVGDWRIVILTPFGSRVHAPWGMLIGSRLKQTAGDDIDVTWTDDGMIFRVPDTGDPPSLDTFLLDPDTVEDDLVREISSSALFAARFRENAARALMLPRRGPQKRTPLWLQRRRAAGLLKVASKYPGFPMMMETWRECLKDVFDMQGLIGILRSIRSRSINVRYVRSDYPSPFSASVLFNYAGNFIYDGDAPLAERKAATLALDNVQLRELLGTAEFRELLDADVIAQLSLELQRLDDWQPRDADDIHDLLIDLGPMDLESLRLRSGSVPIQTWIDQLLGHRRVLTFCAADEATRIYAAAEDAGRLRDALGIVPPSGLADAFLEPVDHAILDLVSRFARTHTPFTIPEAVDNLQLSEQSVTRSLQQLLSEDRVLRGEFLPGGEGIEWCDVDVFHRLKRRSLAALRKEVEPVDQQVLARFLPEWHGLTNPRSGLDGLLDVIEQLQGTPIQASVLEDEILPLRVQNFRPSDLDELCIAGEVIWRGLDSTGPSDGRIALFLTDHYKLLASPVTPSDNPVAIQIRQLLADRGALHFDQICAAVEDFPNDLLEELWRMVWNGEIANDTLAPLRSLRIASSSTSKRRDRPVSRRFRSRRTGRLPGSEGRWSLLPSIGQGDNQPTVTERQMAIAGQLIERYGILTREMLARENIVGGFSGVYPVLKAMEESGRIRRGYFVAGLGAAQFAAPGAEDRLRSCKQSETDSKCRVLAATDPANPWGNILPWPEHSGDNRLQRVAGALVFVQDGQLLAFLSRTRQQLTTFDALMFDQDNDATTLQFVSALTNLATSRHPLLLRTINGMPADQSPLASPLRNSGFQPAAKGLLCRGPGRQVRLRFQT